MFYIAPETEVVYHVLNHTVLYLTIILEQFAHYYSTAGWKNQYSGVKKQKKVLPEVSSFLHY